MSRASWRSGRSAARASALAAISWSGVSALRMRCMRRWCCASRPMAWRWMARRATMRRQCWRCRRCRNGGQTAWRRLNASRHSNATNEAMGRRDHYHVYVIELSNDVLYEGRFKKANPGYVMGKPCLYVGMTGLDPDIRYDRHKAGIQSIRFVKYFGLHLLPELYELYGLLSYENARTLEVELAIDFREAGYGVWQA